jgi:hypothetical protein
MPRAVPSLVWVGFYNAGNQIAGSGRPDAEITSAMAQATGFFHMSSTSISVAIAVNGLVIDPS